EVGRLLDRLGERAVRVAGQELQLIRHRRLVLSCGWGGRIRTSEYGIQSPAPCRLATPHRVPFFDDRPRRPYFRIRIAGPRSVRTAQHPQRARVTRARICRAWSNERAIPNTVSPLPDICAPRAPATRSAAS